MFRDRENKKGGGVGFYVKDHPSFTLRNDITKIDDSIETIWIQVRGKSRNSAFLIGTFYQPSSDEKAKQCWLEKFDRLMAEVYVKLNGMIIIEKQCWLEKFDRLMVEVYVKLNGMIIIAGDFNINLNSDSGESTQRYKQILHTFSLKQHINKTTYK